MVFWHMCLPENARLPRNIQGSFTCRKSTTWDKRLYLPSEGRRAEDFFALKNPTVSAGFEPAKLLLVNYLHYPRCIREIYRNKRSAIQAEGLFCKFNSHIYLVVL